MLPPLSVSSPECKLHQWLGARMGREDLITWYP